MELASRMAQAAVRARVLHPSYRNPLDFLYTIHVKRLRTAAAQRTLVTEIRFPSRCISLLMRLVFWEKIHYQLKKLASINLKKTRLRVFWMVLGDAGISWFSGEKTWKYNKIDVTLRVTSFFDVLCVCMLSMSVIHIRAGWRWKLDHNWQLCRAVSFVALRTPNAAEMKKNFDFLRFSKGFFQNGAYNLLKLNLL